MISYQSLYSLGNAPGDIIGDIQNFKRVDRAGFNITDSIDTRFFKLLFYFYNDDNSRVNDASIDFFMGGGSGLLSPTWLDYKGNDYYKFNSAWAFLKNNYEEERASALESFIGLLSNISSKSPWYFQKITGVDEALSRENWKVSEDRKKITIECLSDPVDHRIESLLSLYRSIVWSHTRKCEILPSNLRKFDMGLFVFSGLTGKLNHNFKNNIDAIINNNDPNYTSYSEFGALSEYGDLESLSSSYKYIEFHNCEFSLDSIKSGFNEITNETGFKQTFSIDIYFDDCYEYEYNPFLLKAFGDFFIWDMWSPGRDNEGNVTSNIPEFPYNNDNIDIDYLTVYNDAQSNIDYLLQAQDNSNELKSNISKIKNIYSSDNPSIDDNNPFAKIGENAKYAAKKLVDQAKGSVTGTWKSIKNNTINSVTGGLGNIYGQGMGIQGAIDALSGELNQQMKSLTNKVMGNINGAINDASRSITSTVTTPVLGAIKNTGTMVSDVVQATTNLAAKPVLGTLKMAENTSKRLTELGTSYIDQAGEYIVSGSEELGNIAYNAQANLPNAIGKNRLNPSSLGNLNK